MDSKVDDDKEYNDEFPVHKELWIDMREGVNTANWEVYIVGDIVTLSDDVTTKNNDNNDDNKDNNDGDDVILLSLPDIVVKKLDKKPEAGKLTISMLFNSETGKNKEYKINYNDWTKIMDTVVLRSNNINCHQIQSLNLSKTKFTTKMMKYFANNILNSKKYPHLRWLNLSNTGLTDKIFKGNDLSICSVLANGLAMNSSLQIFHLHSNPKIGETGLKSILNSITKHKKLSYLLMNGLRMTKNISKIWSEWFKSNPNLPRIMLHQCGMTDEFFIEICKGLSKNNHLRWMEFAVNKISDTGIEYFCNNLLNNNTCNIEFLDFRNNNITDKSSKVFGLALSKNWKVTKLDLSMNNLLDDGVINLLNGLQSNSSLYRLRLAFNNLSHKCCGSISNLLTKHNNLSVLELNGNKLINDIGFETLCNGLSKNSRISSLNFSDCNPNKKGGIALSNAIKNQYDNTMKLINDCKNTLINCDTIKSVINDNKIINSKCSTKTCCDIFPSELIKFIIEEFVGYSCIKMINLNNCYQERMKNGVEDIVNAFHYVESKGNPIRVVW